MLTLFTPLLIVFQSSPTDCLHIWHTNRLLWFSASPHQVLFTSPLYWGYVEQKPLTPSIKCIVSKKMKIILTYSLIHLTQAAQRRSDFVPVSELLVCLAGCQVLWLVYVRNLSHQSAWPLDYNLQESLTSIVPWTTWWHRYPVSEQVSVLVCWLRHLSNSVVSKRVITMPYHSCLTDMLLKCRLVRYFVRVYRRFSS